MTYTTTSRIKDVEALIQPFQSKVKRLQDELTKEGLPFNLYETRRTPQRQVYLFSMGRRYDGKRWRVVNRNRVVTNAGPLRSAHQYGLAADFVLDIYGVNPWELRGYKHLWKRLGVLVRAQGLEWGGDWWRIKDYPHVQCPDWKNARPDNWRAQARAILHAETRRYS